MAEEEFVGLQLARSIRALVRGKGGIKERLLSAANELVVIEPEQLPEDMRQSFTEIYERLTSAKPQDDEGLAAAAIQQMTESDCSDVASDILDLFVEHEKRFD